MTKALRFAVFGAAAALFHSPAYADEPASGSAPGPTPQLCASLGAPATPERLQQIEGWTIRYAGPDGLAFRETILRLDGTRSRSTRFVRGTTPTAHQISVDQRRLCLDLGGEAPECLLAIRCADRGVDFVLVDNDAAIRATVNSPFNDRAAHPADHADLPPGHDWVPFAQGTASVVIEASGPVSSHTETRRSVTNECLVRGHPATRGAFAYAWFGRCTQGRATGAGTLVVLRDNGELERFRLNTTRESFGAALLDGVYSYDFPSNPINAKMLCRDINDDIPRGQSSVGRIDIFADVGGLLQIANPDVRGMINRALRSAAYEVCGVTNDVHVAFFLRGVLSAGTLRQQVTFEVRYHVSQQGSEGLTLDRGDSLNPFVAEEAFRTNPDADQRAAFVDHLRERVLDAWQRDVRGQIDSRSGPPMNVADALSIDHVGTLLALVEGRRLRLPWRNPEFVDGAFIVVQRVSNSDPKSAFFATRRTAAWERWRIELNIQITPLTIEVVCKIPPSSAQRFGNQPAIEARGRLISFVGSRLSLDCSHS